MASGYGVSELFAAGDNWNCTKSSCAPNHTKREMLPSQTAKEDWSENPETGKISVTVRPRPDQDIMVLVNMVRDTVVLKERNGVTWYGSNLTRTGDIEYDTADGTTSMVFEGPTVTREMAA